MYPQYLLSVVAVIFSNVYYCVKFFGFVSLSGSLFNLCSQFLYVAIFCSPGWHEVLLTVTSVVVGFL
jgi:hypothetical protein